MGRWLVRRFRPSTYLSTLVAFAMMLAVPVATLEMPDLVAKCCCPSPEVCRCPDHKGDATPHTSMRTCHRTVQHLAVQKLASFTAPPVIALQVPPAPALLAHGFVSSPHPAPAPRAPDVPS